VHAFDVLGDPVRRILELLAEGEMTSGAICAAVQQEFGISQPARRPLPARRQCGRHDRTV
jgi:hypothetical protein